MPLLVTAAPVVALFTRKLMVTPEAPVDRVHVNRMVSPTCGVVVLTVRLSVATAGSTGLMVCVLLQIAVAAYAMPTVAMVMIRIRAIPLSMLFTF